MNILPSRFVTLFRSIAFMAFLVCGSLSAVPTYYYVATAANGGSDTNNGTSVSTPFLTIGKARDTVRSSKGTMTDDIIVYIRGGEYYQDAKITFTDADSGNNGHQIYYRNYPGEQPVIIGGKPVTGWTLDSGNIYKASLPALSGGGAWQPYAVFENGRRAVQARTPNTGSFTSGALVSTAGAVDPYSTIEAESYDTTASFGLTAIRDAGPDYVVVTAIDTNDYAVYKNVDFRSAGASAFSAVLATTETGRSIEIRLDSTTGTLLGTLNVTSTGSLSTYQTETVSLSTTPTGVHNVYLVFKGGTGSWSMYFDWLYFQAATGNDMGPTVEAENYTSMSGVATEAGGSGTVVSSTNNNDWASYAVNCGTLGNVEIKLQAAMPTTNEFMKIEIHQGSQTGTLLGTAIFYPDTRGYGLFKTYTVNVTGLTGSQTLYLVFKGSGTGDICKLDWLRVRSIAPDITQRQFTYNPSDLPSSFTYTNAQVSIWSGQSYYHFFEDNNPITNVDFTNHIITLQNLPTYGFGPGIAYYVQGSKDFLDSPGEFYFDPSSATIYYWPYSTPISSQEIIAATTTRLIELIGSGTTYTTWVQNINFVGLTLTVSNFDKVKTGGVNDLEGLIYMENAVGINIERCHVTNSGFNAIVMKNFAQYNDVYNNVISGFGYNGVYLQGWDPGTGSFGSASASYVNKLNSISDNLITDGGQLIQSGSAVLVAQSGDNDVSYNRMQRIPKYAYGQTGLPYFIFKYLNYYGTDVTDANHYDFLHARNNAIRNNDIFNCHYASNDGGPIDSYGTGGKDIGGTTGTGHLIQFNRIHDIRTIFSGVNPIAGIYLDGDSAYHTVRYNWIYNVNSAPGTTQAIFIKGQNNTFFNNVVANCTGTNDVLFLDTPIFPTTGLSLTENIFIGSASEKTACYDFLIPNYWDNNTITTSDYNVFSHSSGTYNFANVQNSSTPISFTAWKTILSNKYDQHSTTGTSPVFNNATLNDYTVVSGAPSGWSNFTLTPTNFTQSVSSNIGPGADFAYPTDMYFYDGFENGFDQWQIYFGTPATSTAQAKAGSSSFAFTQDQESILRSFGATPLNKVASVWFYDNASSTSQIIQANADNGATSVALGVHTGVSTTKYVYRLGSTYTATSITRTTGWHQFVFDYRSGSDVKLYIDPTPSSLTSVVTSTILTGFTQIIVGDSWPDGNTATGFYFDAIAVSTDLPATMTTFQDSFENCVDAWVTDKGTAMTSSKQSHSGISSYSPVQDQDAISHTMGANYNKKVSIWFYDDAADTSMQTFGYVDQGTTDVALGVDTATSTTAYVYKLGGTITASSVARSTAWHNFVWDYTSGTNVKLYIDGTLVNTSTSVLQFSKIRLGDYAADSKTGSVYFDDVVVY